MNAEFNVKGGETTDHLMSWSNSLSIIIEAKTFFFALLLFLFVIIEHLIYLNCSLLSFWLFKKYLMKVRSCKK